MHKKTTQPTAGGESRRNFIKKTAGAAAIVASGNLFKTPVYGQSTAPSTGRVIGANDRIVLGFIGLGGQGFNSHLKPIIGAAQQHNVSIAAVCDLSKHRREEAQQAAGPNVKAFEDYEKLLGLKEVDAIFCATVNHWHAQVSIDALNAGKHVYVEKPMTRYLDEAFAVYDTAKKTGKVLQVGSQGCSDMKWHKAAELVRDGAIGTLVMCQGSYMRNTPKGEWNYRIQSWANAQDINWKKWLGDRIKKRKAFNVDDYFRWRKYYQYCSGLLGDLFPHKLHPYMLATGNPEFPVRVAALGSRNVHTDKNTPGTPERDVPELINMIAEFPSGMIMHIASSTVNEVGTQEMMRGNMGTLYMASNRVSLKPERPYADEIDPVVSEAFMPENIPAHHKNFFAAIRGKEKAHAGAELAVRVQTVISLAEMSNRMNTMCLFDPKTRKIKDASGKELQPMTYGTLPIS